MSRYVVFKGETLVRAMVIGAFDTKKECIPVAKGTVGAVIADTIDCVILDYKGRKIRNLSQLSRDILYSLKTNNYIRGAEIIGMDRPGVKPEWQKTIQEKIEEYEISDDIFGPLEKSMHRNAIEGALMLGKPVPREVLDCYPELLEGRKHTNEEEVN